MSDTDIYTFLKNYVGNEIIYVPNPGNAGDSLITFGTLQVFDEVGLNYTIGKNTAIYTNKLLFYAGGGNLVGIYSDCRSFFKNNMSNNTIILLPHTIKDEDELIKNFNDNIIIICREQVSYAYVSSIIKNKNSVLLSKDMAFYIKDIDSYKLIKGTGACNCFRTDIEKTDIEIPSNNIDLSLELNMSNNTTDKTVIQKVSLSVFQYLSNYETINTNRLHIAIAGSLLNKRVYLYSNNYYKNKAVYEYSIKDSFINTSIHNSIHTINPFEINTDELLFFDIFHKNNKVYLIQPVYSSTPLDLSTLKIQYNDTELIMEKKLSKISREPIQILIYTFKSTNPNNTITVTYNSVLKDYNLPHIQSSEKNTLSITTLFKDDYSLIAIFYEYYKKEGVEKFYMYYNGILTNDIRDKFNLPGIILIEWNYKYWNDDHYTFKHHAQIGQINHALYRYGKDLNSHMIFCDLDEYMYTPNNTLFKTIENSPSIDMFGFCNRWANTLDNKIPHRFPIIFNITKQYTFPERSKCIYKVSSVSIIDIHGEYLLYSTINKSLDYILFHFYNWTRSYRTISEPCNINIKPSFNGVISYRKL